MTYMWFNIIKQQLFFIINSQTQYHSSSKLKIHAMYLLLRRTVVQIWENMKCCWNTSYM